MVLFIMREAPYWIEIIFHKKRSTFKQKYVLLNIVITLMYIKDVMIWWNSLYLSHLAAHWFANYRYRLDNVKDRYRRFSSYSVQLRLKCKIAVTHILTGGGQYGDVYEGFWKRHERVIAVKTLKVRRAILLISGTQLFEFYSKCSCFRKIRWHCMIF